MQRLSLLSKEEKKAVAQTLEEVTYCAGDDVVTQGEEGDSMSPAVGCPGARGPATCQSPGVLAPRACYIMVPFNGALYIMVYYIMVHHLMVRYIVSIRHFLTLYSVSKTLLSVLRLAHRC